MISHDGREVWGSSAKRKSLDDRRVIVESGCTIHPSATLGDGVLVQAGAIISHDCVVGAFATICPGVVICGSVMVGEGVTVGAGATVRQGIIIGPWSIIGQGATVVTDVPPMSSCRNPVYASVIRDLRPEEIGVIL